MPDTAVVFKVEWEEPGGVRTPELRATWCRLEMWVHNECVSRIESSETETSRRSIYVPLYPLAEWVAYNWWFLRANRRPSLIPTTAWSYSTLAQSKTSQGAWLGNHNLRGAGEGFPWPDLTIVPEGTHSRLTWKPSINAVGSGISYISSGERLVPAHEVEGSLANLVELALTRLDEAGVVDTALHKEWEALQSLDSDEKEFAEAVARLGLDAFEVSEDVAAILIQAAETLPSSVLNDFLDAVSTASLQETLDWVAHTLAQIRYLPEPPAVELSSLRMAASNARPTAVRGPWDIGYAQARAVRDSLGLTLEDRFPIEQFVTQDLRSWSQRGIDGCGIADDGVRLVSSRPLADVGKRFAGARALWHGLIDPTDSPFLLTRARTIKQKTERAFAAELLAPSEGIRFSLGNIGPLWDSQDAEEIAAKYAVRADVVERQIENNLNL